MGFTHLHVHTGYSLLDGACKIEETVKRAKALGMKSLAITDHGVMYGVVEFFSACIKEGIKPIIGCEIYMTDNNMEDRVKETRYHLILLCKNKEGYKNLTRLVSEAYIRGFYNKPRVDFETLEKYSEGLVCLSACLQGKVAYHLVRDEYDEAKNTALRFQKIFGKDDFYIEIQNHGIKEELMIHTDLIKLAKEIDAKIVATNDVHYLLKEDEEAHDCLLCLQTNNKVNDENRTMNYRGGNYYLKSEDEMREDFKFVPESIDNTIEVAEKCNCHLDFTKNTYDSFKDKAKDKELLEFVDLCEYHVPTFKVPDGMTSEEYLRKLVYDGLKEKFKNVDDEIEKRVEYELNMIINMGFVNYFLLVWDYIHFAKTHDIPVGPGRGSGVGSLVAYCLSITDTNPLTYNLYFERFLNPERVSMPDIDTDFEVEKRGEVIDYVRNKYGDENVAQIVTFTTMGARGSIRDVGRVLGIEIKKCDKAAKLVPQILNINFDDTLHRPIDDFMPQDRAKVLDFRALYETDDEVRHIVDVAVRLEGLPRSASTHASGVLISPEPVYNFLPLARSKDGSIVTQYTMVELENVGMLKMDFLGLRNLSAIDECIKSIKSKYDKNFDINNIPYDDKNIFDMISKGDTLGIFQLESNGMTNFMKNLGPTCIDDLIAGISLFRPGPMDFIPKYIDGKKNQDDIIYDTPMLKKVLETTYGCIVYQEQVMEIFRELAGYSLGRADEVRRAMSKKKAEKIMQEENNFINGNEKLGIDGCVKRGISKDVAKKIFDEMATFAEYAFNKSHAAAYAKLAYQTAYLKYYYKVEFYNSICNSTINDRKLLGEYVANIQADGIKLLPIDINKSLGTCTVEGNDIRLGMVVLNGFGIGVAEKIVEDREKRGRYKSLYDFSVRNSAGDSKKLLNKKVIQKLIMVGAFDEFIGNRNQKFHMYEMMDKDIEKEEKKRKKKLDGEKSILDMIDEKEGKDVDLLNDERYLNEFKDLEDFSDIEKLKDEKSYTGIYISGHPLESYKDYIEDNANHKISDFFPSDDLDQEYLSYDGENVKIVCLIDEFKKMLTKRGEHYARCVLSDQTGSIDCVVFPKTYSQSADMIEVNKVVVVDGKIQYETDRKTTNILANRISEPDDNYKKGDNKKKLYIRFEDKDDYMKKVDMIDETLARYRGKQKVYFFLAKEKLTKEYPQGGALLTEELTNDIIKIVGEENVKIK